MLPISVSVRKEEAGWILRRGSFRCTVTRTAPRETTLCERPTGGGSREAAVLTAFTGPCSECLPQYVNRVSTGSRTRYIPFYVLTNDRGPHRIRGPHVGRTPRIQQCLLMTCIFIYQCQYKSLKKIPPLTHTKNQTPGLSPWLRFGEEMMGVFKPWLQSWLPHTPGLPQDQTISGVCRPRWPSSPNQKLFSHLVQRQV